MGLTDLFSTVLGSGEGNMSVKVYECQECGETFETAKNKKRRISCPECVSGDVQQVGTAD
jgi:predicted Zn-ribbon and HTH transcriptional regulator